MILIETGLALGLFMRKIKDITVLFFCFAVSLYILEKERTEVKENHSHRLDRIRSLHEAWKGSGVILLNRINTFLTPC